MSSTDGWRRVPFGELIESLDTLRVPVKEADREPGPYPYYGASGIVDYVDSYIFDGEYLLIAEDGENLKSRKTPIAFLADGKFWVNNHAHVVRGNECADTRFLLYALTQADVGSYLTGSVMPKLTQSNMHRIPIDVPPLPEQRTIASILGSLDDKIELSRRMNATLEAIAQALFKSWFVDFDPVRAKMEGRQPFGMDAETAALFPDRFEESVLGEIPVGWKPAPFTSIVDVLGGGTPKTSISEYWGGDIPWYSVVDAPNPSDVFAISTVKSITAEGLANSSTQLLPIGTTIISARGTVGKCAIVGKPMAMNQSCYGLRGKPGYSNYFTYYITTSLVHTLLSRTHGAVFDTITKDTLTSVIIPVPSRRLATRFAEMVETSLSRILANLLEMQTLTTIRDTLLPKLLSGEVRAAELVHGGKNN